MEKIWLKSYPPGVAHDIHPEQYSSLTDVLERAFREHADNPFSVCMDRWMTYRDLDRHSAALGAWLQAQGLEPGSRVQCVCTPDAVRVLTRSAAVVVDDPVGDPENALSLS